MTPSITYVAVYSDVHGAVTIASTLPPDTLDRRRLTSGEVLVQGFLQFAAKNGISTTASARHVSALQAALNLSSFDDVPTTQAAPQQETSEDVDGNAFRTAARLGLTLRFYGGCAQSGMPGSPSAYEVSADRDRAAAMREAVERAEASISRGGEAQRLEAPKKEAQELSPTAGMNIVQRILHVGGRNNAAGYVEFGSTQAVEALVRQVLRDLPQSTPAAQGDALTPAARDVLVEVKRATVKFPTWPTDPLHALAVLGEEFGELTKDMLQLTYEPHKTSTENVRTEAIQTAAMALRLCMSLDRYEYRACAQHHQDAARAQAKEGAST